jgi:hypothetical protein
VSFYPGRSRLAPERATELSRNEKSAEAVVADGTGRRAERGEVHEDVSMPRAMRQMPERSGRGGVAGGEAAREASSDEARGPKPSAQGQFRYSRRR